MDERHSGLGIASFALSLGATLLLFLLFIIAGVMEASTPGGIDEESPAAIIAGLGIIFCVILELVALGLGIGGLCQNNRRKLFAVLGVIFAAVMTLLTVLLIAIGNAM